MKKRIIVALLLLAVVFVSSASIVKARGNYYDIDMDVDLKYRNRGEYFVNGKQRTILLEKPWGAIVYNAQGMGNVNIQSSFNDVKLTSDLGEVEINDKKGDINVSLPGGDSISIEGNKNGGYIDFKGKRYNIELNGKRKMTVEIPGDTLTYTSGADWLEISGNKGTTKYTKEANGFTVTSPAGTTTYKAKLNGGYEFDGVAASSHPYYYWGMEFYDTKSHVGVIFEFNRLINFPGMPSGMKPAKAIEVR